MSLLAFALVKPKSFSTFQQNLNGFPDSPRKEEGTPPTSTYLIPQHGRADAGQQQAANAVDVLWYLETCRITLDLNTRTQIADRLCIDFGKLGQNSVVKQGTILQHRPNLLDAVGNLCEHLRPSGQLARQIDEREDFPHWFGIARLIDFRGQIHYPAQSRFHAFHAIKHGQHIVWLGLKQAENTIVDPVFKTAV